MSFRRLNFRHQSFCGTSDEGVSINVLFPLPQPLPPGEGSWLVHSVRMIHMCVSAKGGRHFCPALAGWRELAFSIPSELSGNRVFRQAGHNCRPAKPSLQ